MNDKAGNDRTGHDGSAREKQRELLSALMDGEASEHELRQALRAVEGDAALAKAWGRYHVAQSALHGGDAGGFAHIDLRAAIAAGIDGVDAGSADAPVTGAATRGWARSWLKPLASVAVAATVAVVTVFAWQAVGPAAGGAGNTLASTGAPAGGLQTVALGPMVVVREDGEELVLPTEQAGSPTAGQDRLNAYLARHAQAASMASTRGLAPYARVVSLEGEEAR